VRSISAPVRPLVYVVAGALVGFLFLTEFALITLPAVQVTLLGLALAALIGALRGRTSLALWSLFVVAALVAPLVADSHVVGLPRCANVRPGVACLGGTRDVTGQFAMELLIFGCGAAGAIVLVARALSKRPPDEIMSAGR
jgi:hypothetical protein